MAEPRDTGTISLDQLVAQIQNIVLVLGRLLSSIEDGTGLIWQPYNSLVTSLAALQATMTTQDLIVGSGAGTVARLPEGANGTVLAVVGGVLTWVPQPILAYVAKTADYPLVAATDCVVECTANSFTVTLPTAVGNTGKWFMVKNTGAGIITIARTSSQVIDGTAADDTVIPLESTTYLSNGAGWIRV